MHKKICFGCGAILQNTDQKQVGYTPKKIDDTTENCLCQRCFRLTNYHELTNSGLCKDEFLNILNQIGDGNNLIIYIIDLFDFNGSIIPGFMRHINNNDTIVIANKRDILPKNINDNKLINWLQFQLKQYGIKPLEILLTSSKSDYNLDILLQIIRHYSKRRNVYFVGVTNVGKSSLLNKLILKNEITKNKITTSEFPGTTLGLIPIEIEPGLVVYDTPGVINESQFANILPKDYLVDLISKKSVKPITYQLTSKQTVFLDGLGRIDYVFGEKTSFVFYMPPALNLHRTKTVNAQDIFNRQTVLKYYLPEYTNMESMKKQTIKLKNEKTDIVFSGLGFITINQTNCQIDVYVPKEISVYTRKAII